MIIGRVSGNTWCFVSVCVNLCVSVCFSVSVNVSVYVRVRVRLNVCIVVMLLSVFSRLGTANYSHSEASKKFDTSSKMNDLITLSLTSQEFP